ncbi:MAG: hypothetical protein A2X77_04650 [Gammaproteobacteria bacterium GWE2_42_36]|nr:MAG: hypothetical protein A2X77_04650 [Gammaproteobacteria bacterium GWE2_42_36]
MNRKHLITFLIVFFAMTTVGLAQNNNSLPTKAKKTIQNIGEKTGEAMKTAGEKTSETMETVGQAANNALITTKIKAKMVKDNLVSPFKVGVTTKGDGNVYLSGTINTQMEYERAITLTNSVEGVNNINTSKLQIKKSDQPMKDIWMTSKIKGKILQEKLFGDKDIEYWNVNVEINEGVVYLYGWVENDQQRMNIINIAKNTDGVTDVKDKLMVQ